MLERLLRACAIVASLFVVAGWGVFAVEEGRSATAQTTTELEGRRAARLPDPPPPQERARERAHSAPREAIDDVNDVLLSPFATVAADAGSRWVRRTAPSVIALLLYGFGLGVLARLAAGR